MTVKKLPIVYMEQGTPTVLHQNQESMFLVVLEGSALSGVSRFIHCTSVLLSAYYMLGPLITHLQFSFFLCGGRGC